MIITKDVKIWETAPLSFAVVRDKLMDFCYEYHVAPDDVAFAPYVEMAEDNATIIAMGIRFTIDKEDEEQD